MKLFYSKKRNQYYIRGGFCNSCHQEVDNVGILRTKFNPNSPPKIELYCIGCANTITNDDRSLMIETKLVCIADEIPKDAIIRLNLGRLCFSNYNGSTTIYDIASLDTPYTEDRTRYSGRETFDGLVIGKTMANPDTRLLDRKRFKKLLQVHKESVPLLSYDGKTQLISDK